MDMKTPEYRIGQLEREIARLTRERDEARESAREWDDAHNEACKALRQAEAEVERLRWQVDELAEHARQYRATADSQREEIERLRRVLSEMTGWGGAQAVQFQTAARDALRGEDS